MDCRATPLKLSGNAEITMTTSKHGLLLLVSEVMRCIAQMLPVSCWPSTPLCVFASLQTPGGFYYMEKGGGQERGRRFLIYNSTV